MAEEFTVSLNLPEGVDAEDIRPQIPLIASNLLLASEVIKSRFLAEKRLYSQEEIYKLLFDNWSFWMDVLTRSFKTE